jgi:hypothetical protein
MSVLPREAETGWIIGEAQFWGAKPSNPLRTLSGCRWHIMLNALDADWDFLHAELTLSQIRLCELDSVVQLYEALGVAGR